MDPSSLLGEDPGLDKGLLETVIKTIAHEMIHASRSGTVSDAWLKHDASFRRKAHQIGVSCGFDPLEL